MLGDRNSNQTNKYHYKEEVIHWVSKTSHSNVPTAAPHSPSQQQSRNSIRPRVLLTNLSVASPADSQENRSEIPAPDHGKCSRQPALSVAKKLRFLLSLAKAGQFIVAIAIANQRKVNNTDSVLNTYNCPLVFNCDTRYTVS